MTVSESATDSLYAPQEISTEVLLEKYAKGNETSVEEVMERVAQALAEVEAPKNKKKYAEEFLWALQNGFIPAGRVSSAAGTGLQTTLINCFVQPGSSHYKDSGFLPVHPSSGFCFRLCHRHSKQKCRSAALPEAVPGHHKHRRDPTHYSLR